MVYIITVLLFLLWLNLVRTESKIIYGCEGNGNFDIPYLSRYTLFRTKYLTSYFHIFHRSDSEDLHDHSWNFISIILWQGYNEVTWAYDNIPEIKKTKRIWPGMIIFRKADHAHRVVLIEGKKAYTLVFRFKYVRHWGFFINNMFWTYWKEYYKQKGC